MKIRRALVVGKVFFSVNLQMSGRIGRTGTEPSAFRLQSFGMTKMFRFSRRGTALLVIILLMTGRMAARTPHFARFFNVSLP